MPRDSAGVFSLPAIYQAVAGTTIQPTQHNTPLEDIRDALTGSLPRNGSAAMTGNLPMGTYRITGLGTGTASTDAVTKAQLDAVSAAAQPLDADLTALAALAANGIVARTGTATYSPRTITAGTGLTITDGDGVAGNPTIGLSATFPGFIGGLTLSRASATTYQVAAGVAANEDGGTFRLMSIGSAYTKSLSAWAVGSGNGSLDTGSVANSTWYHVHVIRRDSDGAIDVLLSTSATSPTMPSGWTARRRIGSIRTDGSAQIIAFSQVGDEFLWDAPVRDYQGAPGVSTAVLRTVTVPTGVQVRALLTAGVANGSGSALVCHLSSPDISDNALATLSGITLGTTGAVTISASLSAGNVWEFTSVDVRTNTSAQIRTRVSLTGASDYLALITNGWIDRRGAL